MSRQEVGTPTTAWVRWFNERRLHSALDYQSHAQFEAAYTRDLALPRQAASDNSLSRAQCGSDNRSTGAAIITNRQGKRFTVTYAYVHWPRDCCLTLDYTYQDPVTGRLRVTGTRAGIRNVASITIGAGAGGAHEAR